MSKPTSEESRKDKKTAFSVVSIHPAIHAMVRLKAAQEAVEKGKAVKIKDFVESALASALGISIRDLEELKTAA